ncbi:uncharacterized protein KY384_001591 [Bacidia gigantensis]|uniref:uncharacterized protein n=1 Tax=Bacidia gigantensis TaxID=2732470 RepID=UPI001D05C097|nr:uncharacterized protein KY384_001591 [Bacidia gigantensis]KAG8533850.1 hypothetical protein KY384_001591 [Bacidia gigantensis]
MEQNNFSGKIPVIAEQGAFIPRVGEVVLFLTNATNEKKYWKAGLITQVPHKETAPLTISDISQPDTNNDISISHSGFRVETMSDPNSQSKHEQMRWEYCTLSRLRPLCLYEAVLSKQPRSDWDESIANALKIMATFSLALPLRFTGTWPNASISHGGIFVGSELVVVGDVIRLISSGVTANGTVLVVTAIILYFNDLQTDPPNHDSVSGDSCQRIAVRLLGKLYSQTRNEEDKEVPDDISLPRSMHGYTSQGAWHIVGDPAKSYSISPSFILGRLYEAEALEHYDLRSGGGGEEINFNPSGINEARAYARGHDERIRDFNRDAKGGQKVCKWLWANDRVEALGLHTFGDFDVGEEWEEILEKEKMAYEG